MGNDTWKSPLDLFENITEKQTYFKAAILSRVCVGGRDDTQQVEKEIKKSVHRKQAPGTSGFVALHDKSKLSF